MPKGCSWSNCRLHQNHPRGRQSWLTRDSKNHRGPARSSCRSKRSLTILSQTAKSVTEEAITGYHHCPKSWRRYSGLTVLTQQYCLSSMGSQTPEEFLLKYEATIEASGGGTACKAKALVLALKGLAQRWYANIPPEPFCLGSSFALSYVQASAP